MSETESSSPDPSFVGRIPWIALLPIAFFMAIAPVSPQPHLWEKLKMLSDGTLSRPLDIFDLLMHSTPLVLVVIKGFKQFRSGKEAL
ncbi:MAG: hypothetical protein HW380_2356 [Magnetococcales bacterium]|nr:hypothetical protein [Magnetococcales bacterium]HIJ84000.1 hypothetical protein [Magnetococcales bacterium]